LHEGKLKSGKKQHLGDIHTPKEQGKLKSGKKQHLGDIHTPKEQRKLEIHDKKLH